MTALAGGLCALAVAGASDVQRATGAGAAAPTPIYLDRSYSFQERAADLVSRMTLAEKASQTNSSVAPAIPRLGIAQYGWWNEALHGVAAYSYNNNGNATTVTNTTSYPIDQSIAASWDPDLMYRVASNISDEARETAPQNSLNLDYYSPTMNIERDPRWGRNDESYGEDPLLESKLVDQFVDGMEGKDQSGRLLPAGGGYNKTLTTIKHYTGNNSEGNRLNGTSDMDPRTLLEYDTKPFRDVIQDAQPGAIMSSYNRVNGVPSPANPYLIDTLARETFGFQGYFTSDCDAVRQITAGHHWTPPDWTRPINNLERNGYAQATGEDLDCNTGYKDAWNYLNSLPTDTQQGIKTQTDTYNVNDLDTSLVRLFTARMKLGEFDDVASEPWVAAARSRVPSWTNDPTRTDAPTETPARLALAHEAADKSMVLLKNAKRLLPLRVPSSGPFKVAVIGYFANPSTMYLGGYSSFQTGQGAANEVNGYNGIKSAVQAIDPDATVDYFKGFTDASTQASGLNTVDAAAVAAAADYDAVVVYVGTDRTTSTEDHDRSTLVLPGAQDSLISQVADRNPNTIVYAETVGPIDVSAWEAKVPAILYSSFNGERKGEALADVLLGKYDPSGRLPSTWYLNDAQLPAITDYSIRPSASSLGRTYQYFTGQVRYPFGYGLSYTTFAFSNLKLDKHGFDANDTVNVSVDVTNTGATAGTDTVELYVDQPDAPASLERPKKRLEGFTKVTLDPGQTKTVTLAVKIPNLAFYDPGAGKWAVDDGRYGIELSHSAADSDILARDTFNVSGALAPKPSVVTAKPVVAGADVNRDVAQRVMFPVGATVDPQLTVSMSDDTLYGYILKGRSKPFPNGMKLSYTSDRPSVVSVDGGGIHTLADGVATITATATYGGVTRSTSFVVDVVSKLNGITVDGRPLSGFDMDTPSYEVVVPASQSTVPVVAATSSDPNASVVVTQASGVPGSATIVSTGADGTPYTYTVYFAHPATSDEFDGDSPGPQWSWVRPDATHVTESGGALTIAAQPGDLAVTTPPPPSAAPPTNNAQNLLLQPAAGDWAIETKITYPVGPTAPGQGAGLIVYQNDDQYLELGWQVPSNTKQFGSQPELMETFEDSSFTPFDPPGPLDTVLATASTAGWSATNQTLWLRLVKRGNRYQSFYSLDGSAWTPFYEAGATLSRYRVGVFAYGGTSTATTFNPSFDYFRIAGSAVATGGVGGTVPATLALSLSGTPATFGTFTPGVAHDYAAHTTADVLSTAGDATLSVSDPDTAHTGHLVNGPFALPSPLQASASSPAAGTGSPPADVGGAASPTTLLTYAGPVSHDPVAIAFRQHIGAHDALRTGSYAKTLTFTLSTTTP